MNEFEEMLEKISHHRVDLRPGDYVDNGLVICGKCKKPREAWVEWMKDEKGERKQKKVAVMCDCEVRKAKEETIRTKRKQESIRIQQIQSYGFPKSQLAGMKFSNCDWEGENARLALNYVKHFDQMKAAGAGLLFYGNVGTGKTFLAGCITNALQEEFRTAFMTSFARLDMELNSYNRDDKTAALDRITNCELLVIDDLGIEKKNYKILETEFIVIDARAKNKMPIIVTTNLGPEDFRNDDWGYKRIYDRLLGCCRPIIFKGPSRRRPAYDREKWKKVDDLLKS